MSIGDKLKNYAPLLYWENQVDNKNQYFKFNEMYDFLYKSGYNIFFVFDNFRNYLCQVDYLGLKEINSYLLRMLNKKSARTFYYVDILAVKENKEEKAKNIIKKYLNKFDVKD